MKLPGIVSNSFFRFLFTFWLLFHASVSVSQDASNLQQTEYNRLYLDLNKATDDHKIFVEQIAPFIKEETAEFHLPKFVPGTYTINNFGRFLSDLRAYDISGNELNVEQLDTNRWKINNAGKLYKVTYWVEDTYHSNKKPVVFEPTGSCIEKNKVFVINNYCFFGYFPGYKDLPYELNVTKLPGFFGATSMTRSFSDDSKDIFNAGSYFELHDNPILYSIPDTATVMVNNTRVLLSIYSPNKIVNASYMISHTKGLFEAQGKYLGGELPADRYSILVYLFKGSSKSGSAGALEHFKSTTLSYPEIPETDLIEPFIDVVSHEFFHIVTPLNIHSREIGEFDFINPRMSKHLWLYEGSTEYYAHHCQVKFGIVTESRFLEKMAQKIMISSAYFNDTLPFTEMSKGALDNYKQQYINVYLKGALISMCLDLELLRLSGGKYSLQMLKQELVKKYGPDKPFEDEELFDIITAMTYPEIRGFFRDYVEGNKKLPYHQFLSYAGYDFIENREKEVPAMIGASLTNDTSGRFRVTEVRKFGKALKLKEGDIIETVNGNDIFVDNLDEIAAEFEKTVKPGDVVTVNVLRKDESGKFRKKSLKANTFLVKITEQNKILAVTNPTEEQLMIRKAWIDK